MHEMGHIWKIIFIERALPIGTNCLSNVSIFIFRMEKNMTLFYVSHVMYFCCPPGRAPSNMQLCSSRSKLVSLKDSKIKNITFCTTKVEIFFEIQYLEINNFSEKCCPLKKGYGSYCLHQGKQQSSAGRPNFAPVPYPVRLKKNKKKF